MVDSFLYLSCCSLPDIAFAVSALSSFVASPAQPHLEAVKHFLRYLKGTRDLGLRYSRSASGSSFYRPNLCWGCVDSDWAGCRDTRRLTSGYVLMINGAAIARKSNRSSTMAISTAEAEL